MAATEIQQSLSVNQSEHIAINPPHLRLERHEPYINEQKSNSNAPAVMLTKRSPNLTIKLPSSTVQQSTVESDNKKRPIVTKKNASKYACLSPETPDPNSAEAKSVTIRRMQTSLEEWNKQLKEITEKKERDDIILQSEIEKKDTEIQELRTKYLSETKLRIIAEKKGGKLAKQLKNAEEELAEHKQQLEQFHNQLAEYELAYEQLDSKKLHLEEDIQIATDQLQQSETMRRRLNDHVTELQGQLAIEEQRSKFCTIQ